MKTALTATILCMMSTAAQADIAARFTESAPKDSFSIRNEGTCPVGPMTVRIDLTASAGRLIFDVTGSGAGVQVFQPFELVAGAEAVTRMPTVRDGDRVVALEVARLAPGERVAFTIDVDDTIGQSEIMVSGSEIAGAVLGVTVRSKSLTAPFDARGNAKLSYSACLS